MGITRGPRALAALATSFALITSACGDDGDGGGNDDAAGTETETSAEGPLQVDTHLGVVEGANSEAAGVREFLALPYAAPPTGENRWRDPQPREPYDGVFDATQSGASCPQNVGSSTAGQTVIPDPDEDCLTLDVWAPEDAEGLPVMFWIHGGGFIAGSGHQPLYAGDNLAAQGAVVVNVNYRLGAFGFLATEELAEETEDGSYGNYGIADAAAGLEWVQENIAGFGGDPDNVTIFGESAGGGAVCALMAAPAWNELFDRAIVQSGGTCNRLDDGEEAKDAGADLVEDLGCEDIACMRELDTETITSYFDGDDSAVYEEPELWRGNVIADGVRFTDTARDRAEAGELDGIQIINGSNADEAWLFTLNIEEDFDDEELADVFSRFTDDTDALLALYPAEDYDDNLGRFIDMWTETSFTCPILTFAEVAQNDTYVYNYSFQSEKLGIPPAHGIELVHLFGHPEGISAFEPGLEGADAELSEAMQQAWVSFATDGDPGEGWQPYGEDGLITVLDKVPLETTDEIREGRCDAVTDLTHTSANLL